jgi:hypothetical protein
VFAIFNAAFVPTVYFFYPETALKPLESIDRIFRSPDKNKIGTGRDLLDDQGSSGDEKSIDGANSYHTEDHKHS